MQSINSAATGSTMRELDFDETEAVAGGFYMQVGNFRFASGGYGAVATWNGGHNNGGWTAGYSSRTGTFYVNE